MQAIVQRIHQYPGVSKAFTANNTAGNLILVFVADGDSLNTAAPTDTRGNTYTKIERIVPVGGQNSQVVAYYAKNIAGGANTITCAAAFDRGFTAYEISGADTVSPLDGHGSAAGVVGVTPLTVSVDLSTPGSLYCAWASSFYNLYNGFTASLVEQGFDGGHYDADGARLGVSAGTYNVGVNLNATTSPQVELQLIAAFAIKDSTAVSAAITGTATASITETDIVAGGKTIVITLTNDTWVAAGATFNAQRQAIINGIDSAQAEATGWDAVVKALQGVAGVVRTSNTVVTITLDAQATYNITATETITVTVPSAALTGNGGAVVAAPTFAVTPVTNSKSLMLTGCGA